MRFRWIETFVFLITVMTCGAALADDYRGSEERLDRVERELNQLQRQVYRNEVGGSPAPMTPAGADSGGGALDTQLRLDQIESQLRTLTGQVEELQNGLSQMAARLDKLQADNETRFQLLEGTSPGGAPSARGESPVSPDQRPPVGGFLTPPGERQAAEQPAPAVTELPSGTPADQFNNAFGLLRKQDYPAAETEFKAFLKANPTHPLAANAQYWLAEISYVRGDYKTAAALFAEGYTKYPHGQKAPESLLKLGLSLGGMGQKSQACLSFNRLDHDFPTAAPNVKEQEARGRHNFGC